jgi:hypothetical protein
MCVERLSRFLRDRFTPAELQQLVRFDNALVAVGVVTAVNFERAPDVIAADLVRAAENRGVLPVLATAAVRARLQAPDANEVATACGVAGAAAVADLGQVRIAAVRFSTAFASCRDRLDRLETYKGLHDVLHQIQRSHEVLKRLVERACKPGYDPLDADGLIPTTLRGWLETTENLDPLPWLLLRVKRWVRRFVAAVRLLARCVNGEKDERGELVPAAAADQALAQLGQLPADEQADLNDGLVVMARDLDVAGLDTPLLNLRAALGPEYGAEFQQKYDQFRQNCDTLQRLITDHGSCQEMDAALAEAVELVRHSDGARPRWDEVRDWLTGLTPNWPGQARKTIEARIDRLSRLVKRLAEAAKPEPDWLPNLRAEFGQFFFDLDTALLDATDQLLQTAAVLDFRLGGYTR